MAGSSDLVALAELREDNVVGIKSGDALLSPPSAKAAWNTLKSIQNLSSLSSQGQLNVSLSAMALVAGDSNSADTTATRSTNQTPGTQTRQFIAKLVQAAHETANVHACSSVLAGQGSESDDYGEVGLYFQSQMINEAPNPVTNAKQVLEGIGLDTLLDTEGVQVISTSLGEDTKLPPTIKYAPGDPAVLHLSGLLAKLEHRFAFRLECLAGEGGVTYHFLVGRLRIDDEDAWVGLLGVGISSG